MVGRLAAPVLSGYFHSHYRSIAFTSPASPPYAMPKLEKNTLSLTFKFDSDRFLRFRLLSEDEPEAGEIAAEIRYPPGIDLIKAAGRRWEIDKFDDLIDTAPPGMVHFRRSPDENPLLGKRSFEKVENLFDLLRRPEPPLAVIEGEFNVPSDITPALQRAYDEHGLEPVRARPDILWIRRARTGAPLLTAPHAQPEFEIHVIDVKLAAEPSLRHFTEVTFYALALARALELAGLADRYAVCAAGFIWPGSHDVLAFRNLHRELVAHGESDPLTKALLATLVEVPYEVYQVHVRNFFETRLIRVLEQAPMAISFHVSPTCQLCDYLPFCTKQAGEMDHLSRIAWLTHGQAQLLRQNGINTTRELAEAIRGSSDGWRAAAATSHQLRAEAAILLTRAESLESGQLRVVPGRKTALMPAWSSMNIYFTVHFDPGSGLTFAIGLTRVYFPPDRQRGDPPLVEEHTFVVDRVERDLSPDSERARLLEFLQIVTRWLLEADDTNRRISDQRRAAGTEDSDYGKVIVHFFAWDGLEVKQLRRMLERHMRHDDVVDAVEIMLRMFPPDRMLPDPVAFRSHPGTVVKDVFRLLFGVPVPYDYTLIEVANVFHPRINSNTGRQFEYRLPFGFVTEMSDQIPFHRAYELWADRIYLRHFDPAYPNNPERWRRYTRDEVRNGIANALLTRMRALRHVVDQTRSEHRDLLVLKKSAFRAAPAPQMNVPESARRLKAFHDLDVASHEIENRSLLALPVDEREARFHSVRGLRPLPNDEALFRAIRTENQRYATTELRVYRFAATSRDSRRDEGDFLVALSNEGHPQNPAGEPLDLSVPWRTHAGLNRGQARAEVDRRNLPGWVAYLSLGRLLQVEIARLDAAADPPIVVVAFGSPGQFRFAEELGLFDPEAPLVLDPLYRDFDAEQMERVLRTVGGDVPPRRRGGRR